MMRGHRLLIVAMMAITLGTVGLVTSSPADAQSEEERLQRVEAEIRELERRIREAQSESSEYAAQIEATRERMDALLEVLAEAEGALASVNSAIAEQETEIAALERAVQILTAQLAETQVEQRSARGAIRTRAVELYMNGAVGLGGVVFGVDDVQSATVGLEYAGNVIDDTSVLLRSLEVLERQEETQQERLESDQERAEEVLVQLDRDRVAAEAHKAEVEGSRAEVQAELAAQEALLAKVRAEIASHEDHVGALEVESRELEQEIARRQVKEGNAPGRLAWPVPGPLTSSYGWRVHPIFGTRKLHTGVDLAASTGQSVRAAGNGTVILASTWGGYGRTVIIDHGGGLSTLYAHLSSISSSVGDSVSAGDVVGRAGCSGYCTGTHLHFETRESGSPVNPMNYLS